MIPTTEETATISLKRLFDYQERIAELDKVISKRDKFIQDVRDALDKKGLDMTSNCQGDGLIITDKDTTT